MSKIMTSKFPGTCNTCGDKIGQGETINWIARGIVECETCADLVKNTPVAIAPLNSAPAPDFVSNAWDAAMSWDNDAPAAGASITRGNTRPQYDPPALSREQIAAREHTDAISPLNPPVTINTYATAPDLAPTPAKVETRPDISLADIMEHTACQGAHEAHATPAVDPYVTLMCTQMIGLVNSLEQASPDQIARLDSFARDCIAETDSLRKGAIWAALADCLTA